MGDFDLFSRISTNLRDRYEVGDEDPWAGSPFEWVKKQGSSRRKGKIGELLVSEWAETQGFDVKKSPDTQADRIIEGHRIEIKMSTLWEGGIYKFQQIRDQNYEHCFCLGISPFEVHAWLIPKEILTKYVIGHMGQHTGATGTDTAWLGFPTETPFEWMAPYGSSLSRVASLLKDL